jgi:magnesium transporter
MERYDQHIYLILKMLQWDEAQSRIEIEQVSIVLGDTFVLTFQEQERDVFELLRQRIRQGKGRIRQAGADYLAYALLDSVVDHYFLILERLGDKVEVLEEELATAPTPATLQAIHELRHEILFLRRSVWPLRDLLRALQHGDSDLFQTSTLIYLRDVYEHALYIIDAIEIFREMVAGMLDIYLSSASNRMNEVMKVLTVIATLFIPLTFITSLYGMNFQYMPELEWRWGYLLVWLVILSTGGVMLAYFRRKEWL